MGQPEIRDTGIREVEFGEHVVVYRPVNLYGCKIGDGSVIGPFVEIQRGAVIGRRCRIQSHAFVCDCVTIGDDCFVSHGAMFINDTFASGGPAYRDRSLWRPTVIESGVSIGTHATILPVRICAGSVIGAGSVVTRDISIRGVYAGVPARLIRRLGESPE